jgi:holo-[acyl-carrier protein] synthase
MAAAYSRHGDRLVKRICSPNEVARVVNNKELAGELASIFGVKEAVMKALGTGMRGVGWQEIDTSRAPSGSVDLLLNRRALEVARRLGGAHYSFSVTVADDLVLAAVILTGD